MKLYGHRTDGGAEYLMDQFIECENGHKEGTCEGSKYIVRLDGQPELNIMLESEVDEKVKKLQKENTLLKEGLIHLAKLEQTLEKTGNFNYTGSDTILEVNDYWKKLAIKCISF